MLKGYSPTIDITHVIDELHLPKSTDFGAKPNDFNLLNVPQNLVDVSADFWLDFNKPFLDQAIARGDEIIMATKPVGKAIMNDAGKLTGFGKEFEYLTGKGYHYDSLLNKMIKN